MSNPSVAGTSSERDRQIDLPKVSLFVLERPLEGEFHILLNKLKDQNCGETHFLKSR